MKKSREEFAAFLKDNRIKIDTSKLAYVNLSDKEKWWNGAWKSQTDYFLEKINLENVVEMPILTK
ncbi:hypothetical protein [Intestinibacter sp.]